MAVFRTSSISPIFSFSGWLIHICLRSDGVTDLRLCLGFILLNRQRVGEEATTGFTGTDSLGRRWENGKLVAKPQEEKPAEKPVATSETAPHSTTPPAGTSPASNGQRVGADGTVWARAPAGGAVSPVNDQHYAGGQWMPIHGLSEKRPATPKKPEGQGSPPPKPDEEGRGRQREPRQPMTPEQIEEMRQRREADAKWSDVRGGVLGDMISMGERPHKLRSPVTNLNKWKEYADSIGEDKLQTLVQELQPILEDKIKRQFEGHGGFTQEDLQWALDGAKRTAEDEAQLFPGSRGHLKKNPSSFLARAMVQDVLEHASVDDLHKLNEMMEKLRKPSA